MCIPIRCWATGTRCCWAGKPSSQLTGAVRSPDAHLSHTCSLSNGETTTENEREESREEWLADGQDLCTTLTSALFLCVCHTLAFIFSYLRVLSLYPQITNICKTQAWYSVLLCGCIWGGVLKQQGPHLPVNTHRESICGWLHGS